MLIVWVFSAIAASFNKTKYKGGSATIQTNTSGLLNDMSKVEKALFSTEKKLKAQKEKKLVQRIDDAQRELNYIDWNKDNYWFGMSQSWVGPLHATATSLTVHAYPSYRRYIPGQLDPLRRTSLYFGVGSSNGDTNIAAGPIISYGFGIDVIRGFIVTIGGSTYRAASVAGQPEKYHHGISVGVTLSTEIFKGIFLKE